MQIKNGYNDINASLSGRLYYENTYLDEVHTRIMRTGRDDLGTYVIFEQTIFHPQGGGQPDDRGYFTLDGFAVNVMGLSVENDGIRHYVEGGSIENVYGNQEVKMKINLKNRILFARYHTAGHLIANALELKYPELVGCKGNHFPNRAAVTFKLRCDESSFPQKENYREYDLGEVKAFLNGEVQGLILKKEPITVLNLGRRSVQIGNMKPYACGGTHVKNVSEIGKIKISKVKFKRNDGLKVSYNLGITI